jgi:hypothetical protein
MALRAPDWCRSQDLAAKETIRQCCELWEKADEAGLLSVCGALEAVIVSAYDASLSARAIAERLVKEGFVE